jgi:predicted nucleic acid-binding protein
MTVVADASVLIGLSSIGHLSLLHRRFPKGVLIPQAVWREVVEQGRDRPGGQEVAEANWITVSIDAKHCPLGRPDSWRK